MASPPIYKLDEDILYTIFLINAEINLYISPLEEPDPDPEHPDLVAYPSFDATFRSSQVCRSWRNLLLRSPNIWAKTIRIERYIHWPKKGKEEILKRTGTADLCIKGFVLDHTVIHREVIALLELTWDRAQRVDLWTDGGLHNKDTWYTVFSRPAPCLQSFKIVCSSPKATRFPEARMLLFDGAAPLLREIRTDFLRFRLQAPWSCQLRTLLLETPDTADTILRALQTMPLLQRLELTMTGRGHASQSFQPEKSVGLPNLASLRITSDLRLTLAVAYALDLPRDCALEWRGANWGTPEEMAVLPSVLERYFTAYLSSNPGIGSIDFDVRHTAFRLFCFPQIVELLEEYDPPHRGSLCIHLRTIGFEYGGFISMFSRAISEANLASVTEFRFLVDGYALESSSPSDLFNIFTFLPSLTTLKISECGLSHLLQCSTGGVVLFQGLQKLNIHLDSPYQSSISHDIIARIYAYLTLRKTSRFPILVLELFGHYRKGDWSAFESIDGLKVVCQKDEYGEVELQYVCGSGDGEVLAFRSDGRSDGKLQVVMHVKKYA